MLTLQKTRNTPRTNGTFRTWSIDEPIDVQWARFADASELSSHCRALNDNTANLRTLVIVLSAASETAEVIDLCKGINAKRIIVTFAAGDIPVVGTNGHGSSATASGDTVMIEPDIRHAIVGSMQLLNRFEHLTLLLADGVDDSHLRRLLNQGARWRTALEDPESAIGYADPSTAAGQGDFARFIPQTIARENLK